MEYEVFQKVKNYIIAHQMLENGDAVIAGVSGGGDSMAMLDILLRLRTELEFSLWVMHINHGIRGEEALRDAQLVRDICKKYAIPYLLRSFDVPALSKEWKMGEEETGRKVRLEALAELKKEIQHKMPGKQVKIAVAHNQNDLAETMIHHLARGTGIRGLVSMKPKSGELIRPVLCLERGEIEEYLKEREIPFVTDSTNLEDTYTRNRIRHHILPLMQSEINDRAAAHLADLSEMLLKTEQYLSKQAKALLKTYMADSNEIYLTESFFTEEPVLQEYAVMEALECLGKQRRNIASVHVQQVLALYGKQTGRSVDLPYGILARREYRGVRLSKREQIDGSLYRERPVSDEMQKNEWMLPVPGKLKCELGDFETEIFLYQGEKFPEKKYTKWFDYDKIKGALAVRTRRSGDYLVVNCEGNRKKITRCMIDEKIPKEQREFLPLLALGNEILWMIGTRISEQYKITPDTRSVLIVKYQGGQRDE